MTRKLITVWVLLGFLSTSLLPAAHAYSYVYASGLPFNLPAPGRMVSLSPAFQPVLIKGLKVHPEDPFKFDFIVDPGDEKLNPQDFKKTSQRLVNYFLASLATPEPDLWVNLSPLEKNRIIPSTLVKTELGRDLLAEDYILKEISSSLIYPDSAFGKMFWDKVYSEAYRKFGPVQVQVPVNTFNKIWVLPQKASVFERGNSVYIVKAHLKVMLEEDYLAQRVFGKSAIYKRAGVKDVAKEVMREVVVPAVEKEVNEGKNFARLRQVFYSLILAQWYQDVFKQSILNKDYSGRKKVAGIDVSDPNAKDLIYRQYISAYKKGVFNYIKEDMDKYSHEPVPRKYFSGGFVGQHIARAMVSPADFAMAASPAEGNVDLVVDLRPMPAGQIESTESWYDLKRPLDILKELRSLLENGKFNRPKLYEVINKYSAQVASQRLSRVQGAWPVLKAITLLEKNEEEDLVGALLDGYPIGKDRPALVDKILLMNNDFAKGHPLDEWVAYRAPKLLGRRIYLLAAEIHHWAGGLGPVMKFHGKGMKDLGADVRYIEARYQYSITGTVNISRFSHLSNVSRILSGLLAAGLIQKVSPTEIKVNSRMTLQKFEIEEAQLNWNDIVEKMRANHWAVPTGSSELQVTANLRAVRHRMAEEFGDYFLKLYPILLRSQNVITEQAVQGIAKAQSGRIWDILKQPLDYTDSNIGFHDLKENVDQYMIEMGDIEGRGVVVPQAFANPRDFLELRRNGYVDFMGLILKPEGNYSEFLPGRPDTPEKRQMYETLKRVREGGIHQAWVQVATGVDENGIETYLYRDVLPNGVSSYYTKMLYNYKGIENPVGMEESMTFINVAAAELIRRLEASRMRQQKDWKPAIVHSNDGQFAPLEAVALSRHGALESVKNIFWAFTTHTYKNRGNNSEYFGLNILLKRMMGIKERFLNAFRREHYVDYTSGGVRLANVANGVSDKHRDDVSKYDVNSTLYAVTNGAVPEDMAKYYRRAFEMLFPHGDVERPTADQIAEVKKLAKQWLNEAGIKTAEGGILHVDLDKPMIGYARRLVVEKAGRERAFTDDNILRLVRLGYNVVLMGNHQGTKESEELASGLRELARRIAAEKVRQGNVQYPGSFQFVQSFTAEQKKLFLSAADIQVQDSDNHTGAAEFSEEDITANAGLQAGPTYREGVIVDQGIPLDFEHPNERGQTLIPKADTPASWLETVFIPTKKLWDEDQNHYKFYSHGADSVRLNRIQRYLITSAAYLTLYNEGLEREESEAQADKRAQTRIIQSLENDRDDLRNILYEGRGAAGPFEFDVFGKGKFAAGGKGLVSFLEKKSELENEFGFDAFFYHYAEGHFEHYFRELFKGTGLAYAFLDDWINVLKRDKEASGQEKVVRLSHFMEGLVSELKSVRQPQAGYRMGTETVRAILYGEHNEVKAFGFDVPGYGRVEAGNAGLEGFLATKKQLEKAHGAAALMEHFRKGDYYNYLKGLFLHTPAEEMVGSYIEELNSDIRTPALEKEERFTQFMENLALDFKYQLEGQVANAAMKAPGGIKLDNIPIQRQGRVTADIVSDKALEDMLLKAQGLQGVIVAITPIPNLAGFMGGF